MLPTAQFNGIVHNLEVCFVVIVFASCKCSSQNKGFWRDSITWIKSKFTVKMAYHIKWNYPLWPKAPKSMLLPLAEVGKANYWMTTQHIVVITSILLLQKMDTDYSKYGHLQTIEWSFNQKQFFFLYCLFIIHSFISL